MSNCSPILFSLFKITREKNFKTVSKYLNHLYVSVHMSELTEDGIFEIDIH